jgi:hypothetical protein
VGKAIRGQTQHQPRLNGNAGTYDANEGIALLSIVAAMGK